MPIYEYECKACGHRFDTIQKFSDAPLTDCPKCAAAELRKLISAPAFRLKGGGWYETDFKSGGKRNLAGESAGDSNGSDKGGDKGGGDAASSGSSGGDAAKSSTESASSSKSDGGSSTSTSSGSSS